MNKTRIIKPWNLLQRKLNPANLVRLHRSEKEVRMTPEQIAVISALSSGKAIQFRNIDCPGQEWRDCSGAGPFWEFERNEYRNKPGSTMEFWVLLALSTLLVVGCDQRKAAIDANRDEAQDAIDARKEVVAAEAVDAAKRTDLNATIDKAEIEAGAIATKAGLDAQKIKIDADAAAEEAKVDALKSR